MHEINEINEITLKQILEEICLEEANEFANMEASRHRFSFRHRRAMKRILSVNQPERRGLRYLPPYKRIVIAAVLIFLALFTVTAGAVAVSGFIRKKHRDNTQLFAANAEGCPVTIEHGYYLPEIPDGYKLHEYDATLWSVCTIYKNSENRTLVFNQDVKEIYDQHFDNERASFERVDVNGHLGLYLDFGTESGENGLLVWDNNDYIFEISGNLSKSELINLAEGAKS